MNTSVQAAAPSTGDPRPKVIIDDEGPAVVGLRCRACAHPLAVAAPRCPVCAGPVDEARFSRDGTVWAATRIHVPVQEREPPYTLAYVDLDGGPRVLAHVGGDEAVAVHARVRVAGVTIEGDVTVEPIR
jgi:uncharacterized protein